MAITPRTRDFAVKSYDWDVIAVQLLTVYDGISSCQNQADACLVGNA